MIDIMNIEIKYQFKTPDAAFVIPTKIHQMLPNQQGMTVTKKP